MPGSFEVARLTRPIRLRLRPLSILNRSLTTARIPAPTRRTTKLKDESSASAATGRQKLEYEDFLRAAELEKQRTKRGGIKSSSRKRLSGLPSLSDPKSFREGTNEPPIATASTQRGKVDIVSVPAPSIKGKEKAIESPIEADQNITSDSRRRNPVGVQLLSPSLHSQLFPGPSLPRPPQKLIDISTNHLASNDLYPKDAAVLPDLSFSMPKLQGANIREHFHHLGEHTSEPYASLARQFASCKLPPMPEGWVLDAPGWVKYGRDGSYEFVDDLEGEEIVCFDVETLYKLSAYPVMATAVTPNAWYSWLSPVIFQEPPDELPAKPLPWEDDISMHHPHDLIPLFKGAHPRLVVGHNVGYDRARVEEEYSLDGTPTRWLDTLALHVATRGITSFQRPAWMVYRKRKKERAELEGEITKYLEDSEDDGGTQTDAGLDLSVESDAGAEQKKWEDVTSMNSLAEVASLHLGIPVDKSIRNRFGDESITHASQLRPELHDLLSYCANDVKITHDVYKAVLPLFLDSCPHPASFSGILTMGSSFLPVNESWRDYVKNAESKYRELDIRVKKALRLLAEKLRREGKKEGDPWHEQLSWKEKKARWPDSGDDVPEPAREFATLHSDLDLQRPPSGEAEKVSTAIEYSEQTAGGTESQLPNWFSPFAQDPATRITSTTFEKQQLPLLLRMTYHTYPVVCSQEAGWCFAVPEDQAAHFEKTHGSPVELSEKEERFRAELDGHLLFRISGHGKSKKTKLTGSNVASLVKKGELTSGYPDLLRKLVFDKIPPKSLQADLVKLAEDARSRGNGGPWAMQLDWRSANNSSGKAPSRSSKDYGTWPEWYWDLTKPATNTDIPFGSLDLTCKKSVAPLLLRLQWDGYPLCYSKEHKWIYRVPLRSPRGNGADVKGRGKPVKFVGNSAKEDGSQGAISSDDSFAGDVDHAYFRLPHPGGENLNVGTPLSKAFVKAIESGQLASAAAEDGDSAAAQAATDATQMNVLCSYWISARERIMNQMVVYRSPTAGMILPQVITMGTVTRRAVEATWLTASNAKKNRVGSELKAMIRAPPGYAIVGADVDSEELWISSVMGDSQFGMHGATAIGWMTLEGTKSAGTDLHSKTASILGTSRDAAKVFNYSRIYGAGVAHAVQLLMQGDSTLTKEDATAKAKELYARTKGEKVKRSVRLSPAMTNTLWHGGTESYLFNTLEAIALSDKPTTPALGCGVTKALAKNYLEEGSAFLPSRINWVVQSSGVDYLHLLIVSMGYLLKRYNIQARYLISVHDEVRYLAKEEDRYRCALALQIANAWTRALFCYNLGIDDVPQGVAFFSAVDVDHVLRKEVFMTCETPSHPSPIPPGESLDIYQLLELTDGGQLGRPVISEPEINNAYNDNGPPVSLFSNIRSPRHAVFLDLQANRENAPVRNWLDSQKDIVDVHGESLGRSVAERKQRKQRVALPSIKRDLTRG